MKSDRKDQERERNEKWKEEHVESDERKKDHEYECDSTLSYQVVGPALSCA